MINPLWTRLAIATIAAAVLYLAAVFLLGPGRVERSLRSFAVRFSAQPLEIGALTVNPLTLQAELRDIRMAGDRAGSWLEVPAARARLTLAGLVGLDEQIAELTLDSPSLVLSSAEPAAQDPYGSLAKPGNLTGLRIARVALRDGRITVKGDGANHSPLAIEDIFFVGSGIGTAGEHKLRFFLSGGPAEFVGQHGPAPMTASGRFTISGLDLAGLNEWWPADWPQTVTAGRLGATGEYGALEGKDTGLRLETTESRIEGLRVAGAGPDAQASLVAREVVLQAQADLDPGATWRIRIARAAFTEGTLDLGHAPGNPEERLRLRDVVGSVADFAPDEGREASVRLEGKIGAGACTAALRARSSAPGQQASVSVRCDGLPAGDYPAYGEALLGRAVRAARVDVDLRLEFADGYARGKCALRVVNPDLTTAENDAKAMDETVDIALALLENPQRSIVLTVPLDVELATAPPGPVSVFARALRQQLRQFAEEPFATLAGVTGIPGATMSSVAFAPGSATPDDDARAQLAALAAALAERPRLVVQADGVFDPVADRDALARHQVRLHLDLATSARRALDEAPLPPDFADPKVRRVLEEFAQSRLDPARLQEIRAAAGSGQAAEGDAPSSNTYYEAVFEGLVAGERVSGLALRSLARFRAQSVVAELAQNGILAPRARAGPASAAVAPAQPEILSRLTLSAQTRAGMPTQADPSSP